MEMSRLSQGANNVSHKAVTRLSNGNNIVTRLLQPCTC